MGDSYIIAIDFGTAYSGYAFNLTSREEEEIAPYMQMWGDDVGLETPKTPTCILFDEHEEFISFGYEAKTDYVKLKGDEARKKFFFDCFKMSLYGKVSKYDQLLPVVSCGLLNIMCFVVKKYFIYQAYC